MTNISKILILSTALVTASATASIAQMVDMSPATFEVTGDKITVTQVGWQAEGDTKVKTKAGTMVTGDKAQMTHDGVEVKGERVTVKTDNTITVAQDGEVTIKDNKIQVMGDKVEQQTTETKTVVSPPAEMMQEVAPVEIMPEDAMPATEKSSGKTMTDRVVLETKKAAQKAAKKKVEENVIGMSGTVISDTKDEAIIGTMPKADSSSDSSVETKMDVKTQMIAPKPVETVNIACPEGTTAQSNGTCMITGDYKN